MIWTIPPFTADGWHFEIGWHWTQFTVGCGVGWKTHVVLNLGFGYLLIWRFDG